MENIVNTNNSNLRLCELRVGLFNTLRVSLPMVSPDATNVQVLLTNGTITTAYSAYKNEDGVWLCDVDAEQFSALGKQKYEVAYKLGNKQFWDGQGWVNVVPATTSGIVPQPVPPPHRYAIISITQGGETFYADDEGNVELATPQVNWDEIGGKPDKFPPDHHTHTTEDITNFPSTFPPSPHTHTKSQITDFPVPASPSTEAAEGVFASAKATAEFVNSSINNLAAYYLTKDAAGNAFPTKAALDAATTFYNGGVARSPTKNDYLIVLADEAHTTALGVDPTTRYVYDGAQWAFQYVVNNTSLTQAQVDAINSGITALLVNWLAAFKGSDTNTTIHTILSALSDKLDKSGGTMTGNLEVTNTDGYPKVLVGDSDGDYAEYQKDGIFTNNGWLGFGAKNGTVAVEDDLNNKLDAGSTQSFNDSQKSKLSTNGGYRYKLVNATLTRDSSHTIPASGGGTQTIDCDYCSVSDYTITTIDCSAMLTNKLVVHLPTALDNRSRDLVLKIKVSSSTPPTFYVVGTGAETISFASDNEDWATLESGENVILLTETERSN